MEQKIIELLKKKSKVYTELIEINTELIPLIQKMKKKENAEHHI